MTQLPTLPKCKFDIFNIFILSFMLSFLSFRPLYIFWGFLPRLSPPTCPLPSGLFRPLFILSTVAKAKYQTFLIFIIYDILFSKYNSIRFLFISLYNTILLDYYNTFEDIEMPHILANTFDYYQGYSSIFGRFLHGIQMPSLWL